MLRRTGDDDEEGIATSVRVTLAAHELRSSSGRWALAEQAKERRSNLWKPVDIPP